jgi:sugar phosphate isomerase/epimerase
MAHNVTLEIGINGAFLTRRWEEPDNWMRLTRELGFTCHEFCADVLDPFFSGDRAYQLETARAVRQAAERHGVRITDIYTGVATHRFHGLSHSDPRVRARMKQWIVECMEIALAMGADRIGGHWDAFSVEALRDAPRREAAWRNIVATFRDLAAVARQKGLAALYNEQMYIPSEVPWTLDEAERFLLEVNRDQPGAPVYLTIDVGHQAGTHYGLAGPDLDYAEWLRRFAAVAEIIHLQQTTPGASHHWPFTPECNARGHVKIERVLDAIRWSHEHFAEQPVAQVLAPVERTYLIAEIIPGSTKTEDALLSELAESCRYLRRFVPEGGLTYTIP